jgi:hypothetical protein
LVIDAQRCRAFAHEQVQTHQAEGRRFPQGIELEQTPGAFERRGIMCAALEAVHLAGQRLDGQRMEALALDQGPIVEAIGEKLTLIEVAGALQRGQRRFVVAGAAGRLQR